MEHHNFRILYDIENFKQVLTGISLHIGNRREDAWRSSPCHIAFFINCWPGPPFLPLSPNKFQKQEEVSEILAKYPNSEHSHHSPSRPAH